MDILDFHAHILPRADHGSSSLDETLYQLASARENKVTRIIATPHFYPHQENVQSFLDRRKASCSKLQEHLTDMQLDIKLGAEILICDNIEEMPLLEKLCISGTRTLLLELPFTDFSQSYVNSVKNLLGKGYTVIIAHADRYDPINIDKLIGVGAFVQLNADSLTGFFVSGHIKRWLNEDKVFALGSDIHKRDKRAYSRFKKAINKLGKNANNVMKHSDSVWNK